MIFDSDVLIWLLRGNQKAREEVAQSLPIDISAVTYMELLQGARNKTEAEKIKRSLEILQVAVVPIGEEICDLAVRLVERFALSDSMAIMDALIAATCIVRDETLCTANGKHYKCVPNLDMHIFRP